MIMANMWCCVMSDSEKVMQLMKYLHFSSVHRENELRQAHDNLSSARHTDVVAHLAYYRECCYMEMYNRVYADLAKILFDWL